MCVQYTKSTYQGTYWSLTYMLSLHWFQHTKAWEYNTSKWGAYWPILKALHVKHNVTLNLMDVKKSRNKTAHILCPLKLSFLDFKNSRTTVHKLYCTRSVLRPVCIAHLVSRS